MPKIAKFKLKQLKEAVYNPRTIDDDTMDFISNGKII